MLAAVFAGKALPIAWVPVSLQLHNEMIEMAPAPPQLWYNRYRTEMCLTLTRFTVAPSVCDDFVSEAS
jgi:hypothetical protein